MQSVYITNIFSSKELAGKWRLQEAQYGLERQCPLTPSFNVLIPQLLHEKCFSPPVNMPLHVCINEMIVEVFLLWQHWYYTTNAAAVAV